MLQSYEAEQTLIGLALVDEGCAEKVAQLPEDTFAFAETSALHKIIKDLVAEHVTPNLISVQTRVPQEVNGAMACAKTSMDMAISTVMYKQIELECLDLRKRRIISQTCQKVLEICSDPGEDVDRMTAELAAIGNDNAGREAGVSISEAIEGFVEDLTAKGDMLSTGVAGIDRITGGFQKGMLVILGARPKVGKTALAMSIAMHAAQKAGPVLIISLEMTSKEILTRMVSSLTEVDMQHLVTKNVNAEEWGKILKAVPEVKKLPIRFSGARTPLQIRRDAGQMLRESGLSLIVVDYIQLLRADESRKSRYEEVSAISRELKLLAMDLNVPILALTQFNRESEIGGSRRKPTMSEARDSGSIEQDANMFLIQFPMNEPKEGSDMYDYWEACKAMGGECQILEIAANRQGPTGQVLMNFDKNHMEFTTMTRRDEP